MDWQPDDDWVPLMVGTGISNGGVWRTPDGLVVNLLRRDGDHVIATDWEQFGFGPLGFDLAYLLLPTDCSIDELLTAHQHGSTSTWPTTVVRRGTVLTAAVTVVARAAWSLGQPDPGDHLDRLARLAEAAEATFQEDE